LFLLRAKHASIRIKDSPNAKQEQKVKVGKVVHLI